MESADIRARWLRFFESGNNENLPHVVVPSASLIADDPNLLLVNAGMVPFKPFFLGEVTPPYKRATSVQKCVRTLDIDEVGKTTRHASFFQMCGNFSFGDYFKEGAIALAWDLLTRPVSDGGYGFPESRLWVTVYEDDDEADDRDERSLEELPQDVAVHELHAEAARGGPLWVRGRHQRARSRPVVRTGWCARLPPRRPFWRRPRS